MLIIIWSVLDCTGGQGQYLIGFTDRHIVIVNRLRLCFVRQRNKLGSGQICFNIIHVNIWIKYRKDFPIHKIIDGRKLNVRILPCELWIGKFKKLWKARAIRIILEITVSINPRVWRKDLTRTDRTSIIRKIAAVNTRLMAFICPQIRCIVVRLQNTVADLSVRNNQPANRIPILLDFVIERLKQIHLRFHQLVNA